MPLPVPARLCLRHTVIRARGELRRMAEGAAPLPVRRAAAYARGFDSVAPPSAGVGGGAASLAAAFASVKIRVFSVFHGKIRLLTNCPAASFFREGSLDMT